MDKIRSKLINIFTLIALTTISISVTAKTQYGSDTISNYDFMINGQVWAGENLLPDGKLYIYNSSDLSLFNDTFVTISSGVFSVSGLDTSSSYYYYTVPEFDILQEYSPEYFPTYYSSSDTSNIYSWKASEAYKYNSSTDSIIIRLIKRNYIFYGPGTISGTVIDQNYETKAEGACVLLLDTTLTPLKYTFLKNDLSFKLEHIPYGNYHLLIDKAGLNDTEHPVSLDAYSPNAEVIIYTGKTSTSAKRINRDDHIRLYPNSFNDYIVIDTGPDKDQKNTIAVFNFQGQVFHLNSSSVSGHIVKLNTQSLPDGIYFLRISNQLFKTQKSSK